MLSKKESKSELKRVRKLMAKSTLNPFIYHHYITLKEDKTDEEREGIVNLIDNNNKIISLLKKEIETCDICEIHRKIVNDYIEDLKYSNDTSEEILRIIDLKKEEFSYKNSMKKV